MKINFQVRLSTLLAFALGAFLFGSRFVFSFTEPTATPPLNNVGTPFTPPTGTVLMFNLSSCPSGWTQYSAANGRYVVGATSSIGTQVGSALSSSENRSVGQHSHSISDPGHSHGVYDPGHSHSVGISWATITHSTNWYYDILAYGGGMTGGQWGGSLTANSAGTGISIYGAGTGISIQNSGSVAGTNAPYIQLLMCQKN